jgi:hypothetical protein
MRAGWKMTCKSAEGKDNLEKVPASLGYEKK